MTLIHPMSRASSQRDVSGCITPTNFDPSQTTNHNYGSKLLTSNAINESSVGTKTNILSPPLSPYQRSNNKLSEESSSSLIVSTKVYIPLEPFKIENYKEYELTVNPWSHLNENYKRRQFRFLEQYSIISSKEVQRNAITASNARAERRANLSSRKRVSSSDSDSELERVRTRRIVKESSANLSEYDNTNNSSSRDTIVTPSTPKRRKTVKKESQYTGSPLAIQQAALIDENIPDYSPGAETLPKGNNRCLKVEWKGQPMDLRNDPNASKLHPAEVLLASILRLPCNVYMDSKRRLFFEKVNRLKRGQQFRRTDAQKACRIDVNKASRLFAAFEKVGWLEDDLFARFL